MKVKVNVKHRERRNQAINFSYINGDNFETYYQAQEFINNIIQERKVDLVDYLLTITDYRYEIQVYINYKDGLKEYNVYDKKSKDYIENLNEVNKIVKKYIIE